MKCQQIDGIHLRLFRHVNLHIGNGIGHLLPKEVIYEDTLKNALRLCRIWRTLSP